MKQKLPKNHLFRIFFPLIYGSVLYVLILLVFENFQGAFDSFFSSEWLFTIGLSYLSSEMLHLISVLLSKKIHFTKSISNYLIIHLSVSIVAEFMLVFLAIHLYFTLVEGFSVYLVELKVFELFYIFSVVLYNLFVFSYLFLNEENTLQNIQENEYNLKNEFQIKAVQDEIEPDLLFAAMESLLIYIRKDTDLSTDIVDRLSKLYRYRLENRYNELIPAKDEIKIMEELIRLYNYLFPDSIEYVIRQIEHYKEYLIVPLWLQKIILTIFKCNILSPLVKFYLSIDIKNNKLVIEHSRREKLLFSETDEINKISDDFKFFTERKIEIIQEKETLKLIVPLFRAELAEEHLIKSFL